MGGCLIAVLKLTNSTPPLLHPFVHFKILHSCEVTPKKGASQSPSTHYNFCGLSCRSPVTSRCSLETSRTSSGKTPRNPETVRRHLEILHRPRKGSVACATKLVRLRTFTLDTKEGHYVEHQRRALYANPQHNNMIHNPCLLCYVHVRTVFILLWAYTSIRPLLAINKGYTLLYCILCNERGLCWLWG